MCADIFGNLREWGRVLEALETARAERLLDEHQAGLARILRFRGNGRLIERVLDLATEIRQASDLLIAEVCNLVVAWDVGVELRVKAARALGHLLVQRPEQTSSFDPARVVRTMEELVAKPAPPVLADALNAALAAVREARGARR
jgi:hypothetical protein